MTVFCKGDIVRVIKVQPGIKDMCDMLGKEYIVDKADPYTLQLVGSKYLFGTDWVEKVETTETEEDIEEFNSIIFG